MESVGHGRMTVSWPKACSTDDQVAPGVSTCVILMLAQYRLYPTQYFSRLGDQGMGSAHPLKFVADRTKSRYYSEGERSTRDSVP